MEYHRMLRLCFLLILTRQEVVRFIALVLSRQPGKQAHRFDHAQHIMRRVRMQLIAEEERKYYSRGCRGQGEATQLRQTGSAPQGEYGDGSPR